MRSKGRQTIPAGAVMVLEMPGGGGYGPPDQRDPAAVLADVRSGFVSRQEARKTYGVTITDDLRLAHADTETLRAGP